MQAATPARDPLPAFVQAAFRDFTFFKRAVEIFARTAISKTLLQTPATLAQWPTVGFAMR